MISRPKVILGITFVLVLLSYFRTVTYRFVYDDFPQIVMNPWLVSWRGLRDIFTQSSWAYANLPGSARYYRPLYVVWLWAVRMPTDGSPFWFHLAAVLSHLVVICLAFSLAVRLLASRRAAAIAAMLFALHPSKIEAVAWIGGASEVVHAAFFFAFFVAYFRWREGERWPWLALSSACFAAALLAKETALLAPALVLAFEWLVPLPGASGRKVSRMAALAAPYAAVTLLYLFARNFILGGLAPVTGISATKTACTVPLAFCWYLKQVVWPFHLGLFYPVLIVRSPEPLRFFGAGALLVAVFSAYWFWARRSPEMRFLLLWFVSTLIPVVAAILLLQPHDRYLYLPSFALAVFIAKLLSELNPRVALVAALALAAVYSVTTFVEEPYWADNLSLFSRAVAIAPEVPRARELLAAAYVEAGDQAKALQVLQDGYALAPGNPGMSYLLALAHFQRGEDAQAAKLFRQTIDSGADDRLRDLSLSYLARIAEKQSHSAASP